MTSTLSEPSSSTLYNFLSTDFNKNVSKKKSSLPFPFLTKRRPIIFNRLSSNDWLSKGVDSQHKQWGIPVTRTAVDHSIDKEAEGPNSGILRKKLAIFVSGGGSNFKSLQESILEKNIYGDIAIVVSDRPGCKATDFARSNNIPVIDYPRNKHAPTGLSTVDLVATLREYDIDFVLLAGYLKMIPQELVQAFPRAILNIHPALLPAFGGKGFYGMKVHEAVIKSGARFSGPTVHFVDDKYDHGVILAQRIVPVLPYDTPQDLAARVLKEEHSVYKEVVAALCEDRISWREDGVPLIRKSSVMDEYY